MKEIHSDITDALTEIINIGVGRAAAALHDLLGKHISLEIPSLQMLLLEDLPRALAQLSGIELSAVQQMFKGDMIHQVIINRFLPLKYFLPFVELENQIHFSSLLNK